MDLWYAAYGSNMSAERLHCYLEGGCPPGATRTYPGARDRTLPRDRRPIGLDGTVYFAWRSPTWGGGVAFLDPHASGRSVGTAYRLSLGQFSDLAHQEMHREPGTDLHLDLLWSDGAHELGPGRYESLHVVGRLDGLPVVTFTSADGLGAVELNAPTGPYLATMARGLAETHGWDDDEVVDYLLGCPGVEGAWDAQAVRDLVREQAA